MGSLLGVLGLFTLLAIAYFLSENKNAINYKTVVYGLIFQLLFALFIYFFVPTIAEIAYPLPKDLP